MLSPDGILETHVRDLEAHWGCALSVRGNAFELPKMAATSPSEWESIDLYKLRESCKTYVQTVCNVRSVPTPMVDAVLTDNVAKRAPFLHGNQIDVVARMILKELTSVTKDIFLSLGNYWLSFISMNLFSFDNPPCGASGGILWGDTGVGKTVQTCALIAATNKMKTLIVCPAKLVKQWQSEIRRFIPDQRLHVMYGAAAAFDESADVILTSYNTLINRLGVLDVHWDRLVMDEGAEVGYSTVAFRFLVQIQARRRWVLTATPLSKKNTMDHFHVLCWLIGIKDEKEPDYRFFHNTMFFESSVLPNREGNMFMIDTSDTTLVHRICERVQHWGRRKSIAAVCEYPGCPVSMRKALAYTSGRNFLQRASHDPYVNLASGLFLSMCIRQRQTDVTYRIVENRHPVRLRDDYLQMLQRVRSWWGYTKNLVALGIMRGALNFETSEETLINLLNPLRPSSMRLMRDGSRVNIDVFEGSQEEVLRHMGNTTFAASQLDEADTFTCPICLEDIPVYEDGARNRNLVFSQCAHPFCREHGMGFFMSARRCWCRHSFQTNRPVLYCVTGATGENSQRGPVPAQVRDVGVRTAKIEKACEVINGHLSEGRQVVVFCANDKSCHDLHAIVGRGKVVAGTTPIHAKQKLFGQFQSGEVHILFTTPRSSSTGINLQAASAIVFADPCVFDAERKQCIGRVARIGQASSHIYIDTVYAENTCEEIFPLVNNNYLWTHINFYRY